MSDLRRQAKLLFFWDYDTQWGADRSRTPGGRKAWGELEFTHTERLLELHAKYEVPACFAIVGSAALPGQRPYHDPAQIRRIHAAGHEIASHSHHHEWLPALNDTDLRGTLSSSKDAIEQCIGSKVVSFVPPFNQPFDYPRAWSFSLSERFAVRKNRADVKRLCGTLADCGYRFCRLAYRPLLQRIKEKLLGKRLDKPVEPTSISSICCVRVNTPSGFGEGTKSVFQNCASKGGIVVVWGHPHSLGSGNAQDEKYLVPFLEMIVSQRKEGKLGIALPHQLLNGH